MKKINTLLLLLVLPIHLGAQSNFQYVSPLEYGVYNTIAINHTGDIIAAGSEASCPKALISCFDSKGELRWEIRDLTFQLNVVTDVVFDWDGNVVLAGWERESDDYGSATDGFFLLKLNIKGDTLFNLKQPAPTNPDQALLNLRPDSTYIVAMNDHLYWFSKEGMLLKQATLSVDRITGFDSGPEDNLIAYNSNGAYLLDQNGALINSYFPEDGVFIDVTFARDTTWLLTKNELWQITSLSDQPHIDTLPVAYSSARIANDGFLVLATQDSLGQLLLLKYTNSRWEPINIQPSLGSNIRDFLMIEDQYYFVGQDFWERSNNAQRMYGAYLSSIHEKTMVTNETQTDISLESVTVEVSEPVDTFTWITIPFMEKDTIAYGLNWRFMATITVMNTGTEPIHDFVFFSQRTGGFNCSQAHDYYQVDNIEIRPSEFYSFTIPLFLTYYDKLAEPLMNRVRCFYVAAPNQKFDTIVDNNSFCATLVNSVPKRVIRNYQVQIFPNPASTTLNIKLNAPNPIQQIQLFDLQGQGIATNIAVQGQEARLERGNLPAGIYFLKISTKDGMATQKVIFQ